MDLDDLRLALAVAERGGFAAAARALDLDPSSVSRGVAGLERRLGFRLFQRSTRRLVPTDEGARYLARIKPLLAGLERAEDEARGAAAQPAGLVRLTASVAFGTVILAPLLGQFRARCPEITLDLALTDAPLDLIAETVDIAIRLAPAPSGDLTTTRLMRTRYRVVASPDWIATQGAPARPSALSSLACLRQTLPEFRDRWLFRGADGAVETVRVGGPILCSSPLALREAARASLGPALLADWLIADDFGDGRLVDLFPAYDAAATAFDTGAFALHAHRAQTPLRVRATLDFLIERLRGRGSRR